MAFDQTITNGVVCLTFHGILDAEDLRRGAELFARMEAEFEPSPNRMADLSSVDRMDVDFGAVEALAAVRRIAPLKNKVKSAIIAPKPVLYGFARMFQTLNDNPDITLKIFRDRDLGWAWLNEAETTAGEDGNAK
jgi:hypothetical protein